MERLIASFFQCLLAVAKYSFPEARLGTRLSALNFWGFYKIYIFPRIKNLDSFSKFWGNSWIEFLVMIIYFGFTWGVRKYDKRLKRFKKSLKLSSVCYFFNNARKLKNSSWF